MDASKFKLMLVIEALKVISILAVTATGTALLLWWTS